MKNSTKIFIALTSLVLWAACQEKAVYKTSSFVKFASTSLRVAEMSDSIVQVSIPVYAYQSDGSTAFPGAGAAATNTSVTFQVVDGTATRGVNYDLVEPANGVLEFQGDSIQYITVEIYHDVDSTGTLNFSLQLLSATNGFSLAANSTMNVNITDLEESGDNLLGDYTATGDRYGYSTTTWTMTFVEHSGSEGNRQIYGITPYMVGYGDVYGTLSSDYTTFTITLPQFTGYYYSNYDAYEVFLAWSGSGYYSSSMDVTFTYEGGQWTSDMGIVYGLSTTEGTVTFYGYFEIYNPGIVLEAQ